MMTIGPAEPYDGKLLVVLPCLNERESLPPILGALLSEPDQADALFVVADGGSTDGTREWVREQLEREPRLRLLDNVRRIQSAGVNEAVRSFGRGRRWLVRIDAHADYPRGYVTQLVRAAEAHGADSVVVTMATRGGSCFQRATAAAQNSLLGTGGARHRWGRRSGWVDHGHHALFDLDWFRRLGGYDERFVANEDAEYDQRLAKAGGRIWMEADCPVVHYPRATARALYRQYRRNGEGRAQTLILHRRRPKLRQLAPIMTAPAVVVALAAPWAPAAAIPVVTWAALCLGFGLLLGARARGRCELLAGGPAMIMHFGWSVGFWKTAARQLLHGLGLQSWLAQPGPDGSLLTR
jgi:succinoglycan biosynthesis protein ExoA